MPKKKKPADGVSLNESLIEKTVAVKSKTSKAVSALKKSVRSTATKSTATKASAGKTAAKRRSLKGVTAARKSAKLPGEMLRDCLSECASAIDKAVGAITMLKLPLLKMSVVLQTFDFLSLKDISPRHVFLAPAIAERLIAASLSKSLVQDLREIFRHYAAGAENQQIREGCIAGLCCLELHLLSGWPPEQNPLWISLLQKSADKFVIYWPPQSLLSLASAGQIDQERQTVDSESLVINPYFYKYITRCAVEESQKLFVAVENGKYDSLWELAFDLANDRIDQVARGPQESIQIAQNSITWQWEQKIYRIIAENSQLDPDLRRILMRELDCFSCRDNPVLLLAVLRQQHKS